MQEMLERCRGITAPLLSIPWTSKTMDPILPMLSILGYSLGHYFGLFWRFRGTYFGTKPINPESSVASGST